MNSNTPDKPGSTDLLARLSYLGDLFLHRRVVVVADDPVPAAFLAQLNARYICSISEGDVAPTEPIKGPVDFKTVAYNDLKFRDGMFDIAVIPNLAALSNRTELLTELRRVVGRRGTVIAASPNPACENPLGDGGTQSIDYYELYDHLSQAFDSVQMVGQAPFVGYAVSDLSASEDTGISFDGSLLEDAPEEIEWFVAVCGSEPVNLEGFAIVQVPLSSVGIGGDSGESEKLAEENMALQQKADSLQQEAVRLEEDLRHLEDEMRELQQTGGSVEEMDQLKDELHQVRLEMGTRGVRIETLENDIEHERHEAEAARERAVQLAKQFDDERKAMQAREIEQQFAARQPNLESQQELGELRARLRQADQAIQATERARDEIIDRTRRDAQELDRLHKQLSDLQKREQEFITREDTLRDQLANAHRELRNAMEGDPDKVAELEKALSSTRRREEDLDEELKHIRAESTNIQKEMERVRSESASLKKEMERVRSESASLKKDLKNRPAEDTGDYEEENARLENRLRDVAAQLKAAQEELERREALTRDLTAELRTRTEKIASVSQGEQELAVESEKLTALEALLAEKEDALHQRDGRIAKLESELQATSWKVTELQTRSDDAKKAMEDNLVKLGQAEALLAERAQQPVETTPATAELAEMEEKTAAMESELAAAMGAISGHHRARVEAELSLSTLEQNAAAVGAELDESIARVRDLEDELAAAMGTISGHHRMRVEAELQIATHQMATEKVRNELDEAITRSVDLDHSLAEARGSLFGHRRARLEAELAVAAEKNDKIKLREKLADVQAEFTEFKNTFFQTEELTSLQQQGRIEAEQLIGQLQQRLAGVDNLQSQLDETLAVTRDVPEMATELQQAKQEVTRLEEALGSSMQDTEKLRNDVAGCDTEIERLRGDVAGCDAEIARLRTELEAARGDDETQRKTIEKMEVLEAKTKQLQSQLQEEMDRSRNAGADAARLSGENEELIEKAENLEMALAAARDEATQMGALLTQAAELEDLLEKQNTRVEELEKELENRPVEQQDTAELDGLKAQVAGLGDQLEKQKNRVRDLEEELENRPVEQEDTGEDSRKLLEDVMSLTRQLEGTQELLNQRTQQVQEFQERLTAADQQKEQLVEEATESAQELSTLQQKTELLQEKLGQQEVQLSDTIGRAEGLEKQLGDAISANADSADAEKLNQMLEEKEEALTDAKNKLADVQMDFAAKNLEISQAKGAERAAKEQVQKLVTELEQAQMELDAAQSTAAAAPPEDLANRLTELEAQNERLGETIADLQAAAEESQPLVESLTSQLEQRERANIKSEKKIRMLQNQLKETEGDAVAWDMELKFRDAKIEAMEEEITELKNKL